MRRSMLSLSASRSEAGVATGESSEPDGKPLTCTAGRDEAVMVGVFLPSARGWQAVFSIKDVRVGRPAAPNSREERMSAMAINGENQCG